MNDKEEWKRIIANGILYDYCVSNKGQVYSMFSHALLQQNKNNKGYLEVKLYHPRYTKIFKVHRLVAMAFIPNPYNLPQVNHKIPGPNGKVINTVDNLEWCTSKENMEHASKNHLLIKPKGELHHYAQYSDTIAVQTCKMISDGYSNKEIMDALHIINIDFVKSIRSRKTYNWLSCTYTFPKYTNEQLHSRRIAKDIKSLVLLGYNNKSIKKILNLDDTRKNHDLIKGIRSNKQYKDIVCDELMIIIE